MTLLALLRLTLIDQLKIVSQMHHIVVFKVVDWFLAAITEQQGARCRPLCDISVNDRIVVSLVIRLRAIAPRLDTGVDIQSLTRQAVGSQPCTHRRGFIHAR